MSRMKKDEMGVQSLEKGTECTSKDQEVRWFGEFCE